MKIALYSDLHLETMRRLPELERVPTPPEGTDLIVLAGDVHQGTRGLELLAEHGRGHVYVSGNHEYYGHDIELLDAEMFALAQKLGLHYLQNSEALIQGVRFLGCTLWTDYGIQPAWRLGAELVAKSFLPDYKLIRSRGRKFSPRMGINLHQASVAWLTEKLETNFAGPTVIVTHHAPHPQSIHPRFALSPINAAFVSDLTRLMGRADVWLHGHMHDSFDYVVANRDSKTRVITNPRGYLRKKGKARLAVKTGAMPKSQVFENAFFNPSLLIVL